MTDEEIDELNGLPNSDFAAFLSNLTSSSRCRWGRDEVSASQESRTSAVLLQMVLGLLYRDNSSLASRPRSSSFTASQQPFLETDGNSVQDASSVRGGEGAYPHRPHFIHDLGSREGMVGLQGGSRNTLRHWTSSSEIPVDPEELRPSGQSRFARLRDWRVACLLGLFLVVALFTENKSGHIRGGSDKESERISLYFSCTAKLSPTVNITDYRSPEFHAVDWLLVQGDFQLDSIDCKSWDTTFGSAYAMFLLRHYLGMNDWSLESGVPGICTRWKRVHCNEHQQVSKLSFNNANIVGSIPTEVGGLVHLEELYFNTNYHLSWALLGGSKSCSFKKQALSEACHHSLVNLAPSTNSCCTTLTCMERSLTLCAIYELTGV